MDGDLHTGEWVEGKVRPEPQRHFKCDRCVYASPHRNVLLQHVRTVHEKGRGFKCQGGNSIDSGHFWGLFLCQFLGHFWCY